MRRIVAAASLALALVPVGATADPDEGCVAANPGYSTCTYVSTRPGDIAGVGNWRVEVWWDGVCDDGPADWVRAAANGDNNGPAGMIGTWEGSVAPGACARAWALSPQSAVAIGSAADVPEVPEAP